MLWVVIKRETGDQRRENRGGRGEKVGVRGRKKNGEGNNIEREREGRGEWRRRRAFGARILCDSYNASPLAESLHAVAARDFQI